MSTTRKRSPKSNATNQSSSGEGVTRQYCAMRELPQRSFASDVSSSKQRAIILNDRKWVNGTTLHYAFFENQPRFAPLAGTEAQKKVFRDGVKAWVDLGIGLKFEEVNSRSEAQLRIAFQKNDGHWSYIGRDVLKQGVNEATLNLDPTAGNFNWETAAHEIGHSMGLPHEHQNPRAGIVWKRRQSTQRLHSHPIDGLAKLLTTTSFARLMQILFRAPIGTKTLSCIIRLRLD